MSIPTHIIAELRDRPDERKIDAVTLRVYFPYGVLNGIYDHMAKTRREFDDAVIDLVKKGLEK